MKNAIWKILEEVELKFGAHELVINSSIDVYYIEKGKFQKYQAIIPEKDIELFVREISYLIHQNHDVQHPVINGVLKDGTRVNIVSAPISPMPLITIRKYVKRDLNLNVDNPFILDNSAKLFLKSIIKNRKNFVLSGGIGVGKTTFLSMLLNEIPPNERTVIIEDFSEIECDHPAIVKLMMPTNKYIDSHISLELLIENATKMKADRLVLGACKGAEFFNFIEALGTGLEGSITTIHANSVSDAIIRLENCYQMQKGFLGAELARRQIFSSINYIIHLGYISEGRRSIIEIFELHSDIQQKVSVKKITVRKGELLSMIEGIAT